MSERNFGKSSLKASRSGLGQTVVPKASADIDIQISGNASNTIQENYMDGQTLRTPKEYMFARSDFSKEKAKLEEVLDTGVLFRYHEPNAENIPVAKLE